MARRRMLRAVVAMPMLAVVASPLSCVPSSDATNEHSRAAARAGAIRRCGPIVDLSTPRATFCSYLGSYEKRCVEGMYLCLSRRLRQCCGCANCSEFCAMLQSAPPRSNGDEAVVRYYRSLIPTIERQFANCFNDVQRFAVVFREGGANREGGEPSRLAFVLEEGGWRLDVFEVYVPGAAKGD